jgi:iron complex transport system ATP-binding protein
MRLVAQALAFGFPGRVVGRDLDLEMRPGEVLCLLGPNGGGKTTLMRTLLGFIAPLAGEVRLDERPLAAWPRRERARRVAYVPQAAESYFDFSVLEMVEMGRSAYRGAFGSPSNADRMASAEALERLGIARLAARPIHAVSGGELQLALIARALASGAEILVLDEPTANLDFGNQALILAEIARLREAGKSVLLSTHQPDHAQRVADRALLLRDGRVAALGPVASVLTSEALTALFGRPVEVIAVETTGGTRRVCVPS